MNINGELLRNIIADGLSVMPMELLVRFDISKELGRARVLVELGDDRLHVCIPYSNLEEVIEGHVEHYLANEVFMEIMRNL